MFEIKQFFSNIIKRAGILLTTKKLLYYIQLGSAIVSYIDTIKIKGLIKDFALKSWYNTWNKTSIFK